MPQLMTWKFRFRFRQHLRQSLWAVPLVGAVVGLLLAYLDQVAEGRIGEPAGWTYSTSTASGLLTTVAGAMVGLLGLVVTIGVLVVQMATGTLSPRFMRLWYRDRLQKLVLASFTATFVFSYALLREVSAGTVPNLGITMVGVAVTVDLFLLLLYLDRFVHALRPVAVAATMARAGLKVVNEITALSYPLTSADHRDAPQGEPALQVRARERVRSRPSTGAASSASRRRGGWSAC